MIELVSLAVTASTATLALTFCGSKDREQQKKKSSRDASKKSSKSGKSKAPGKRYHSSTISKKSQKKGKNRSSSRKGAKKSGKSEKSQRSKRSSKSGKSKSRNSKSKKSKKGVSEKSEKSKRSSKAKKSENSVKSQKTQKSSKKSKSSKSKKAASKAPAKHPEIEISTSQKEALENVPNNSHYSFPAPTTAPTNTNRIIARCNTLRPSPDKLPFDPHGEVKTVTVSNTSNNRMAFKVKCSDKMLYRVNPVFGFVDAGQKANIQVLRFNGETKTDNLVVLTSQAAKEENDAKKIFDAETNREMLVIPLLAY